MFKLVLFLVSLGVSFAAGYGIREMKSRRRRAVAREEYLRKHPEREMYSNN